MQQFMLFQLSSLKIVVFSGSSLTVNGKKTGDSGKNNVQKKIYNNNLFNKLICDQHRVG
jgi:hypothetical protein